MANALYSKYKELILGTGLNLTSSTIKVAMVTDGYTYSDTHQFYGDITPASNVVGTPQTLTNITITGGAFNADDAAFTGLNNTATIKAFVIYNDTGSNTTSPLICYLDTGTGLPISLTTSVTEVDVTWSNSPADIFAL